MIEAANRYLDADELMHLALNAAREGRNEETIVYFKRALEVAPNEPALHYLLGSHYLRIGLTQRAVGHIEHALALNPGLDGARFQLGWLYWAHSQVEKAAETWKRLDEHGAQHPLYLFKTGLLHLAKEEYEACADHLRRGIEANQMDAALNHDMAQILKQVQSRNGSAARAAGPKTEASDKPAPNAGAHFVPKAIKPQGAAKADAPAKPEAPKAEAAAKPKAPRSTVLSAYKQNDPGASEH